MTRRLSRRRRLLLIAALVLIPVVAFGLLWFQPWKLWIDERVNDALPAVVTAVALPSTSETPAILPAGPTPSAALTPATTRAPAGPRLLARGELISHEHSTRGSVSIVAQPDGTRELAIAGLATSNGPDLKVWLADAPVLPGSAGWHIFDDTGRHHVSLGSLKGNLGNQVYAIPADADLSTLTSITIWCDRFNVSFGAAELHAVTA